MITMVIKSGIFGCFLFLSTKNLWFIMIWYLIIYILVGVEWSLVQPLSPYHRISVTRYKTMVFENLSDWSDWYLENVILSDSIWNIWRVAYLSVSFRIRCSSNRYPGSQPPSGPGTKWTASAKSFGAKLRNPIVGGETPIFDGKTSILDGVTSIFGN